MANPVIPAVPQATPVMLPPEALPNVEKLVTEDGAPVDSMYSEKQMRLLTEPLYSSWPGPGPGRPFVATANVGMFYAVRQPPLVPDVLLSLDVQAPDDLWVKAHRSYFFWEYGKPPEAVIEVVSNVEGEENGYKLQTYARIGILYYVIWDPENHLRAEPLSMFVLRDKTYVPLAEPWLPVVGLGLTVWHGTYEGAEADWLRWCDRQGQVIPTGAERAEQERQRAEEAHQRAERLAAQLRAQGIEPA